VQSRAYFQTSGQAFYEPAAGSSISGFGGQSVMRLRPEALLACHDVVCVHPSARIRRHDSETLARSAFS
jgi:hypothetical protein